MQLMCVNIFLFRYYKFRLQCVRSFNILKTVDIIVAKQRCIAGGKAKIYAFLQGYTRAVLLCVTGMNA